MKLYSVLLSSWSCFAVIGSTSCHSERSAIGRVVEESRVLLFALAALFLLASCGEDVADVTNIN